MSPASGDIPGLWRGASPTGSGISPALRGMSRPRWCGAHTTHMCHMSVPLRRSKPTQQHVKRCLCNTTRPSEGSWCAAVAAAGAAFVPGGEARTSEPHREARRGERREAGRVALRPPCAAVARPLRPSRGAAETLTARAARAMREAAEPPSLRHGKERGRGVRKEGAEARRCGALEAPARERTRRLS